GATPEPDEACAVFGCFRIGVGTRIVAAGPTAADIDGVADLLAENRAGHELAVIGGEFEIRRLFAGARAEADGDVLQPEGVGVRIVAEPVVEKLPTGAVS